jgi:LCP family protein required for cell wall assembly
VIGRPKDPDAPPRLGRSVIWKAGLAALLVIALTAGAVSASVILEVTRVKDIFTQKGRQAINIPEVTAPQAGGPRTILVLGSDQRYSDKKLGLKPRSDTILLGRVNPAGDAISVLSIPRDLRVEIPGYGQDKINAAFEDGGPRLTVRTIQALFKSVTGRKFAINNVLVVNFGSFKAAVDYIHGVYIDVDRRYFNDQTGPSGYAAINIQPGYQKLTGTNALAYVRYRHTDNDIVRAARQQDFLRQAKNSAGFKRLLSIANRDKLARLFSKYFQFDKSFTSTQQIFGLLKLGLFLAQSHPALRQIRFPYYEAPNPAVDTFLYYHSSDLAHAVHQFMTAVKGTAAHKAGGGGGGRHRAHKQTVLPKSIPGMVDAHTDGENLAVLAQPKLHFPFYFPTLRYQSASFSQPTPRIYSIRDETGKRHKAYRIVVSKGMIGEYYGIQGTTWKAPPILDNPDQVKTIDGRKLLIYLDGQHLRIVAFRTPKAVYWVSNTLTESLTRTQMLAIAATLKKLKG